MDEDKRSETMEANPPKRLGVRETLGFVLPDSFWDPLPKEELRLWNGEGE